MKKLHLLSIYFVFLIINCFPAYSFGGFFIENKGQIIDMDGKARKDIVCCGDIPGYKVYITDKGISFVKVEIIGNRNESSFLQIRNLNSPGTDSSKKFKLTRTDLDIPGLNTIGYKYLESNRAYFNFYLGHCKEGILNAASFRMIEYPGITDGADLQIAIEDERLIITISSGKFNNDTREFYRTISNLIKEKHLDNCCSIEFSGDKNRDSKAKTSKPLGFRSNLAWSSYLGGTGWDNASNIETDSADNVIIGGSATSFDFPVTEGSFQTTKVGDLCDIFLFKFDEYFNLLWGTYIGGGGDDILEDINLSIDNTYWLCGISYFSDDGFPISENAFQQDFAGITDCIFGNFTSDGYRNYLSFYGGTQSDNFSGIFSDKQGNVFLCGETYSPDFPVSTTTDFKGPCDAVIVEFNKDFKREYSSFFGGINDDFCIDIKTDSEANVFITGQTYSYDFPVKNAIQPQKNDSSDVFITKFDKNFNVIWSTFYGGSDIDYPQNLIIDGENNILIEGMTNSKDFKITKGALQEKMNGWIDEYILKLDNDCNILWCTYFGGSESKNLQLNHDIYFTGGIDIDNDGNIGITSSVVCPDLIVSDNAVQKSLSGVLNVLILILDKDGKHQYSSYFGGSGGVGGEDIVFNSRNELLIAGTTTSKDLPVTEGALQDTIKGPNNGYFMMLGDSLPPKFTCDETGFSYTDFNGDVGINYAGKAYRQEDFIRLTNSSYNKTGGIWHKNMMPVSNGFTTKFKFRMSEGVKGEASDSSYHGADGIAFVIQNISEKAIGISGGKLGYDPIPNSLAIEYDLFSNDKNQIENLNDPNGNHVAVMSKGKEPNSSNHLSGSQLGLAKNIIELKSDGTIYYSKIDYNIKPGVLRVFLSSIENGFGKPVIEIPNFNLSKLLNLTDSEWAYVGFTSATGSSYQNHDILSWSFCPKPTDSHQTGVEEGDNTKYPGCMIYPNPAVDELNINTGGSQHTIVSIYNLAGESIRTYHLSNGNTTIDISELPDGLWFARIKTSDGRVFYEKFIKK